MSQIYFPGDIRIAGNLLLDGSFSKSIDRSNLSQETALQPFPVEGFRSHDALHSLPPSAGGTTHLGLVSGTFGSDGPTLQTGDLKAAGGTARRTRLLMPVPKEYVAGQSLSLRLRSGMITTVSDGTATIDAEVHKLDGDGAAGGDICTTDAQSINSLTFANKDFSINPAGISPGDMLDVRISITVDDGASATAVIGALALGQHSGLRAAIKG